MDSLSRSLGGENGMEMNENNNFKIFLHFLV